MFFFDDPFLYRGDHQTTYNRPQKAAWAVKGKVDFVISAKTFGVGRF